MFLNLFTKITKHIRVHCEEDANKHIFKSYTNLRFSLYSVTSHIFLPGNKFEQNIVP